MSSFKLCWILPKSERSADSCAHFSYLRLERLVGGEEDTMGGPPTQGSGVKPRRRGPKFRSGISVEDSPKPNLLTEVPRNRCMVARISVTWVALQSSLYWTSADMCDVVTGATGTGAETGFTGKVDGKGSLVEQLKDSSLKLLSTTE